MSMTYSQQLDYDTTPECRTNGLWCDGFHSDGRECICSCHGPYAPVFENQQDVVDYHVPDVAGVKCSTCGEQWTSSPDCHDCTRKGAEIDRLRKGPN